jgi:hypothetical protein
MNRDIPWSDLHLKVQENLIHFLDVELDLVGTLCDRAECDHDAERRAQLLGKIKQAIDRYDTSPIGSMTTAHGKLSSTERTISNIGRRR